MPDELPNDFQRVPVSSDTPCSRCGYSLKALPLSGDCPECGASVLHTVTYDGVPVTPRWHGLAVTMHVLLFLGWISARMITVAPRAADSFQRNWFICGGLIMLVGLVLALFARDRNRPVIPLVVIVLTGFLFVLD